MHAPVRRLHRYSADREFQSLVSDGTHIGHQLVAEIGAHRYLYRIQEVPGIAYIGIDASAETVMEESEIDSDIPRHRGLPPDLRVISLRIKHSHIVLRSHIIFMIRIDVDVVAGQMGIISDSVLLTCKSCGKTQLQCSDIFSISKERFLLQVPCKSSGREEAPPVRLGELAGSVTSGCECKHILRVYRPVQTAVERHQIVLGI